MPGALGSGGAVDLKRAAFWRAWSRCWCTRLGPVVWSTRVQQEHPSAACPSVAMVVGTWSTHDMLAVPGESCWAPSRDRRGTCSLLFRRTCRFTPATVMSPYMLVAVPVCPVVLEPRCGVLFVKVLARFSLINQASVSLPLLLINRNTQLSCVYFKKEKSSRTFCSEAPAQYHSTSPR